MAKVGAKPRPRQPKYDAYCAAIVQHLFAVLQNESVKKRLEIGRTNPMGRLHRYTGISAPTLKHLLQVDTSTDHKKDKPAKKKEIMTTMPDEDVAKLRPAVLCILHRNMMLTVERIHTLLKVTHKDWKWSISSTYRALQRIGFTYHDTKIDHYKCIQESKRNVSLRRAYLKRYFKWKKEGRPMVYMDESWINQKCTPKKVWSDGSLEVVRETPHGKGRRWILLGAGSEKGWIKNSFRMWKGTSKKEDYHTEMNGKVFHDWVHDWLLPNVPRNAVIVVDRAPYHLQLAERARRPKSGATKADLIDWIVKYNCEDAGGAKYTTAMLKEMTVAQLKPIVQAKRLPPRYLLFDWLKAWNEQKGTDIRVNVLPIAHPQLNPIELVWSWLKTWVKKRNKKADMNKILALTQQRVMQLNGKWWKKSCDKAHRFAEQSKVADRKKPVEEEEGEHASDAEMVAHYEEVYENELDADDDEFSDDNESVASTESDENFSPEWNLHMYL